MQDAISILVGAEPAPKAFGGLPPPVKQKILLIKSNKIFFLLYGMALLTGIAILILFSKADGFIFLNLFHRPYLDVIFRFLTFLGDGWFIIALTILLFFIRKKRLALLVVSSYALSGLIVMGLKNLINAPRPKTYFENSDYKMLINLNDLFSFGSFPSGHTTSAFALATVLACYFSNKKYSPLLIIYACLVGYSRIYLAQHFLLDVLCGSFFRCSFCSGLLVFHYLPPTKVKPKLLPTSTLLRTCIVCPCASMICLQMDKPSPLPPTFRLRARSVR